MLLSKEEYEHALKRLETKGREGGSAQEELLQKLREWGKGRGMEICDYFCDRIGGGRLRLKIVLWDRESGKKVMEGANYNGKKQRDFAEKFAELSRKYKIHREYWKGWDVFVAFDTLRDEIQKEVAEEAEKEICALACGDIWRIEVFYGRIHCFYETDRQAAEHEKDGVSEAFREKCREILRRRDRYDVFKDGALCTFTSKQTLDEKYDGKMFFYFR